MVTWTITSHEPERSDFGPDMFQSFFSIMTGNTGLFQNTSYGKWHLGDQTVRSHARCDHVSQFSYLDLITILTSHLYKRIENIENRKYNTKTAVYHPADDDPLLHTSKTAKLIGYILLRSTSTFCQSTLSNRTAMISVVFGVRYNRWRYMHDVFVVQ